MVRSLADRAHPAQPGRLEALLAPAASAPRSFVRAAWQGLAASMIRVGREVQKLEEKDKN